MLDNSISLNLDIIELKSKDRDSRYNEAMQDARICVREKVAFSDKGMYRFWAYEISDNELVIMYIANHCAIDGTSMVLLNNELEMLYENLDRTDIPNSDSFAEFMIDRKKLVESDEYKKNSEYWRAIKENCEVAEFLKHEKLSDDCISMEIGAFTVPLDKVNKIARAGKTSNFNVVFLMYRLALYELIQKKICL